LIQSPYHLIDAIVYFIAAAVPIYFLVKSKSGSNNPLRKLMMILAGFVIAQGIYHTAGMLGMSLLSKALLEPLSAGLLVLTAIAYLLTRKKMQKQEVNSSIGN
jgi:hypothetical protein